MPVLDSACFLGLTAAERLEQLYLAVGGTDDGCFLGNTRTTQLRLIGEVLGLDPCFIYSDADLYREWLLALDSEACTGMTLQGLQNAVYALLYDGTGVLPECFLGLDPDAQEQAIVGAAGGSGPVSNWILREGTWHDDGIWIDTETWND